MTEENKDLAGRFARFCAAMIDGIILIVLLFAIAKITGFWEQIMPRLAQNIPLTMEENIIAFVVGQALFLTLNGMLLAKHGQTIGKAIIGVKIVDTQQNAVGFAKLYVLRYLTIVFISMIPVVGSLLNLLNILFIFGKERRCLHDRIAGTIVIVAK